MICSLSKPPPGRGLEQRRGRWGSGIVRHKMLEVPVPGTTHGAMHYS